jgi:hypothetical protein
MEPPLLSESSTFLMGIAEVLKSDMKCAPQAAPQRKEDLGAVDELSQESS